jgi:uncharacterized protein YqjF (DUF2071 family)
MQHPALSQQQHRLWPLPAGEHYMTMDWLELAFLHWSLDPGLLRPLLPAGLELDTWEGRAYIGVVPFRMENVNLRRFRLPAAMSAFPELNLRTYVVANGKSGVWFFSLEATNPLAVRTARAKFSLPYYDARIRHDMREGVVSFRCRRTHRGAEALELHTHYSGAGDVFHAAPGSLEHWLCERYCLYSADARGRLYRGEVHHQPWPLQQGRAVLEENTVFEQLGIELPAEPEHVLYSSGVQAIGWRPMEI